MYARGEAAAEKLRCILQRLQCRGLLDLWELFERHDQRPDEIWPTFERKARHRGSILVSSRIGSSDVSRSTGADGTAKGLLIGEVPKFDDVEREVRRRLRGQLR